MAKILLLLVTVSTLAYVSANISTSVNVDSSSPDGSDPTFVTTFSQWIVDTVSRKIVSIARFFNLKLRLVRFIVSLWTTENLILFRNLLEEALRFGNFALSFLPKSAEDPFYWWVPAISDFINVSVGDAGLFGVALGPVTSGETTTTEKTEVEISEIVTNPPFFFNVPLSSTEEPTTESNDIDSRSKRLIEPMEETVADQSGSETEDNEDKREDLLKRYEENVITLDKLINGRTY